MASYTQTSCPRCGAVIEGWRRSYRALGPPFTECRGCHQIVLQTHVSEWDLLSGYGRFRYYWSTFYTALISGFVPVMLLMIWLFIYAGSEGEALDIVGWPEAGAILATGEVLSFAWWFRFLRKEIRQSRLRLEDQAYKAKLGALGLLDAGVTFFL